MQTENFKKTIIEIVKNHKFTYSKILFSKKYADIMNFILENTIFLNEYQKVNPKTRIWCIIHNINEFPKCKICGKKMLKNIKNEHDGFAKYCSPKCENSDPEVFDKLKKTNLYRYGTEWSFQSENNKTKSKNTMLEKYGVEYAQQNKDIKNKSYETMEELYGNRYAIKCDEFKDKALNTIRHRMYEKICKHKTLKPMFDEVEFLKYGNSHVYRWKCEKCGNNEIYQPLNMSWFKQGQDKAYVRCEKCYPILTSESNKQNEIYDFIKTVYDKDIMKNMRCLKNESRNPLEIDIVIPDRKLGIEFDGLYWHSEAVKGDHNYHIMKTNLAEKYGIKLIHIFENEWIYKKEIVESRIKHLLGIHDKTIYARNCVVKNIDYAASNEFQDKNHIQGHVNSSISLGLFHDGELISLMTFGKSRFNKKYEYELLRFCNKLGYHIPGAAGKLLKHFERNYMPKSLISYADRRWSSGNVYEKLGFTYIGISKPNYWYFKNTNLESRIKFQKHKLHNLLPIFDDKKTEVENMYANGYNRIFDCGNLIYVKTFN